MDGVGELMAFGGDVSISFELNRMRIERNVEERMGETVQSETTLEPNQVISSWKKGSPFSEEDNSVVEAMAEILAALIRR